MEKSWNCVFEFLWEPCYDDCINVLFQVLYVCLGTPAGYVSARIYKSK